MIRRFSRGILVLISVLVSVLMPLGSIAHAATPTTPGSGGNGLRISPVRLDTTVEPGKTRVVTLVVTNVTSQPATLQAAVNDFVASSDESGNPTLLLGTNQYAPSHSLKRYIGNIPKVTLKPGEQKNVDVPIIIPKNAVAGGYFGAVRFGPASIASGPNENLSLAGSVGTIILIKVPGNIHEQLSIASFDVRHKDHPSNLFTTNKDLTATMRFQNQGDIQEAPFGKILLKNSSNKIIATYEFNAGAQPSNVLPDSIRKFSVPIDHIGKFGKYKLEGNFGYGPNGQLLSASTSFYVVPKIYILLFLAVVALIAFLVFGLPRLIRAYNRRVIRNARRR